MEKKNLQLMPHGENNLSAMNQGENWKCCWWLTIRLLGI